VFTRNSGFLESPRIFSGLRSPPETHPGSRSHPELSRETGLSGNYPRFRSRRETWFSRFTGTLKDPGVTRNRCGIPEPSVSVPRYRSHPELFRDSGFTRKRGIQESTGTPTFRNHPEIRIRGFTRNSGFRSHPENSGFLESLRGLQVPGVTQNGSGIPETRELFRDPGVTRKYSGTSESRGTVPGS